jgi:hypothetical protein
MGRERFQSANPEASGAEKKKTGGPGEKGTWGVKKEVRSRKLEKRG